LTYQAANPEADASIYACRVKMHYTKGGQWTDRGKVFFFFVSALKSGH
jgi:hypothetical protein